MTKLVLIFASRLVDGGSSPNEQIFIEADDINGNSINVGEWAADGEHESLTIDANQHATITNFDEAQHFAGLLCDFFDHNIASWNAQHDEGAPQSATKFLITAQILRDMLQGGMTAIAQMTLKKQMTVTEKAVNLAVEHSRPSWSDDAMEFDAAMGHGKQPVLTKSTKTKDTLTAIQLRCHLGDDHLTDTIGVCAGEWRKNPNGTFTLWLDPNWEA